MGVLRSHQVCNLPHTPPSTPSYALPRPSTPFYDLASPRGAPIAVLRSRQDSLMAMLEAFIHDPLIKWRLLQPEAAAQKVAKAVPTSLTHPRGVSTARANADDPLRRAERRSHEGPTSRSGDFSRPMSISRTLPPSKPPLLSSSAFARSRPRAPALRLPPSSSRHQAPAIRLPPLNSHPQAPPSTRALSTRPHAPHAPRATAGQNALDPSLRASLEESFGYHSIHQGASGYGSLRHNSRAQRSRASTSQAASPHDGSCEPEVLNERAVKVGPPTRSPFGLLPWGLMHFLGPFL